MVTLIKYGALSGGEKYNINQMWIDGLSTDSKPTTTIEGMLIPNGSVYTEVDTGKTYMFDKENVVWYEVSLGGGGGGGGTTNYNALENKPQINSHELSGNKSSSDLGLQTALTETQLAAVNSGIDSTKVEQIETNKTNISFEQQKTTGMTEGGSNYITVGGIRVYVSATAPTGDIPDGSVGVGW